jgi:hypothetical protein
MAGDSSQSARADASGVDLTRDRFYVGADAARRPIALRAGSDEPRRMDDRRRGARRPVACAVVTARRAAGGPDPADVSPRRRPGIGATPPEWSVPLAWGDAATSMLAALAMTALYREWPAAIPLAWAATVFGALDLLHNGFNAAHLGVAPSLGPIVYVVVIAVPGMLTAHVLALRVLLRSA